MINKTQARQNKLKIIDSRQVLVADKVDLIMQLKVLLPGVVNADNQLDIRALADVVDVANTTSNNQGYELTFAGKGIARALADVPTELELKAELGQSKDFDNSQNVVIRGDNLEVLKILQANYHKKIKMIYIDPPYNTKNENFIYKDNFKQSDADLIENFALDEDAKDFLHNVYGTRSHSGWLSFIYPRLKLARDLLSDDGVIFISIDDNEQANLKILCDEIFGEYNFVANIIWEKKYAPQNDAKWFSDNHDHILVYGKNKENWQPNLLKRTTKQNERYKNFDNDIRGDWKPSDLLRKDVQKTGMYTIITPSGRKVNPASGRSWRVPQYKYEQLVKDKRIWFGKDGDNVPCIKRFLSEVKDGIVPLTIWKYTEVGHNQDAIKEMKHLFNDYSYFDTSKPVRLINKLLEIGSNKNDIILDFFAGSGTTGDAVMQLNAQDGGNRRFILVQIDEAINKKKNTEAHKFCTENNFNPVISSITIERLNRAGEKIKADFKQKTKDLFAEKNLPDIGYKVFSCAPKPQVSQQQSDNENVFLVENQRQTSLNTLVNMLVATCKTLDSEITCLIADKLYRADGEIYLLANVERQILQKYQDCKINLDGWADIDLSAYLNLGVGQQDNISVVY